jgi:predicted glycogen debranching enzyme
MIQGENTVVIGYEVLAASGAITLELCPILAARNYHSLNRANSYLRWDHRWEDERLIVTPYEGITLCIDAPQGSFHPEPYWLYNVEYPVERQRGFDFQEDLASFGKLTVTLRPGERWAIVASTDRIPRRDGWELLEQERIRRESLENRLPNRDPVLCALARAADQFVVKRGADQRSIIAGYHWFTDWGRDTMIALPGLCLVTRRFEEARSILRVFAESCSEGMLPNRFPDHPGEQPEYNTADATLWFFVAARRYMDYTSDEQFLRDEIWPTLRQIIQRHEEGTRFDIKVDEDGLLNAGNSSVQLTWMDAKIGNWVVTPRAGKAVEINALWYNALMIAAEFAERWGDSGEATELRRKAARTKESFNKHFWNSEVGALYDYIDERHTDEAIRPNQIIALALPYPLLDEARALSVVRIVEERLYTPVGLRSLDPAHPNFQPRYIGSPYNRDSAYHQGTVWSWLLGPYMTALVRYRGEAGRIRVGQIIELFKPHLLEGGIGTVSEIFDGEAPHTPRGCIAQAWGVGEILRGYAEDYLRITPPTERAPLLARASRWIAAILPRNAEKDEANQAAGTPLSTTHLKPNGA